MFQHDKGKQHAKQRAKSKQATKELRMRKQTTQTNKAFQDESYNKEKIKTKG